MPAKWIVLFTALPLLEIYLLVKIGTTLGLWPTVLIVVGTGVVGALLARHEGIYILRSVLEKFRNGQLPAQELIDGAILLISGAFLLTPGIVTDFIGLLGLIPFTRRALRSFGQNWVKREWNLKSQTYVDLEDDQADSD